MDTRRRPLGEASWHSILVPWFHPASHMLHPELSGIQELQVELPEGPHRRCLGKGIVVESLGMLTTYDFYDFLGQGTGRWDKNWENLYVSFRNI